MKIYLVFFMKISLNWLKDYIDISASVEETSEMLSDLGFPCEGIEKLEDDEVIDIEVTSNRGDCLGHIGVARELSAFTGFELKLPDTSCPEEKGNSDELSVEIREPELCSRYTARLIEGIKVGPSPDWMKKRLEAVGIRSVNNVVDATNYAMLETGQPPHAFDYDKITEGKIIVRKAKQGERITSIDGTKCDLDPEMLVIADPKGPVAIAGVMGGLHTEVSDDTTKILLEDAHFNPVSVRTTSRKLVLPSEAAYRFERIVDTENIDWASKRTAQLIIQVAGGKLVGSFEDKYPVKHKSRKVTLRLQRLNKLLGLEIPADQAMKILERLEFLPEKQQQNIICKVPSWRSDCYREADLIEEVARVHGYNKVPTENKISIEVQPVGKREAFLNNAHKYLNGSGYFETINVTFLDEKTSNLFLGSNEQIHLKVTDVTRKEANLLRQSLLPSLLKVLKTNLNAKNTPCRIYEIADTFVPSGEGLPLEKTKLSIVSDQNFRELKGLIEGLVKSVDRSAVVEFEPCDSPWAKAAVKVLLNDSPIGIAGLITENVKKHFDLKDVDPCCAEIDIEKLVELQGTVVQVEPVPKFPAIERDFSLIIDESIAWQEIEKAVYAKAEKELESLDFKDIYRGKGIPNGKKSLTLTLRFRDVDGTLTHQQVSELESPIVENIKEQTDAEIRTA